MPRDPLSTVLDMIQAIETAERLAAGMGEAEFLSRHPHPVGRLQQIITLGEAASRLSRSFCDQHPGISWSAASRCVTGLCTGTTAWTGHVCG